MIPNLTIHMMIKNEEKYIVQTLRSVLEHAEYAIIVDTGSTDSTIERIQNIVDWCKSDDKYAKITFLKRKIEKDSHNWDGNHLNQELTNLRNEMLSMTDTDWVWQVDGDEIYLPESIKTLKKTIPLIGGDITGIQHGIKWCINNEEFVLPGPFPTTLRVFPSDGYWNGEFPNEFFYYNNIPMTMTDRRCAVAPNIYFLHMSMALHPERRPPNGRTMQLTEEEKQCLSF